MASHLGWRVGVRLRGESVWNSKGEGDENVQLVVTIGERVTERSVDLGRADDRRAHFGSIVAVDQLDVESLVQSEGGGLAAAVFSELGDTEVGGGGCSRHDVSMVDL